MQVEEYYLLGKRGDAESCEDAIVVNDRLAAVLDGTTSQVPGRDGHVSPGRKAVDRIAEALETMPGDADAFACFTRLNAAVAEIYREEGTYEQAQSNPEYRSSAAAIVYSRFRSELWLIGDCQALVDDRKITAWKDADALLSEVRSMYLESELLRGKTIEELRHDDTGRGYIRELLVRQKQFQNLNRDLPYAFHVLDGFLEEVEPAVEVHRVPPDCRRLVLASDGYPVLEPTLAASERSLAEIIERDPLCFRSFKSTKGVYGDNISFDDRAYLSLRLG